MYSAKTSRQIPDNGYALWGSIYKAIKRFYDKRGKLGQVVVHFQRKVVRTVEDHATKTERIQKKEGGKTHGRRSIN